MVRRCLVLFTLVFMLACEQDDPPEPIRTIPKSVQPHVDRFINEAEKRGISLDVSRLSIEFDSDINISTGNDQQTVVGSCSQSGNLDLVKIDTLNSLWLLSGTLGREEIIFHELGHCLLGRQHRDDKLLTGDYASIMRAVGLLQYGDLNQYTSLFLKPTGLKAHRRDYYLDELFDETTPVPCWSDPDMGSPYEVRSFEVDFIAEHNYRYLWVGPGNDLWFYGGEQCHVLSDGSFKNIFPDVGVTDLQNDNQGNLWVAGFKADEPFIGTYINGQLEMEPITVPLPGGLSGIDKIFIDDLDRLWISDEEGTIFVRNHNQEYETIQVAPERRVTKILSGPDHKVYMLKGQMFLIFDPDLNPFIMNDQNSELPTDLFRDMAVDGQGVAWLRYSRPAPYLVKFLPDGQVEVLDFYDINLAEARLNSLTTDHLNNLWAATSKGIKKWEGSTFSSYCTYNTGIDILEFSSIIAGENGIIWSIGEDTTSLQRKLLQAQPER